MAKKNPITGKEIKSPSKPEAPESVEAQDENAALRAELEAMKVELANAKAKKDRANGELTIKVSKKGAVSLYGMGRFPTTLYRQQWEKVFANKERIEKFMKDNEDLLPDKDVAPAKK